MRYDAEQKMKAAEFSVDTLQKFHSTIIALAFGSAVLKLITCLENSQDFSQAFAAIALSVAFVSTIVPFYHGMARHLYDSHVLDVNTVNAEHAVPLLLDIFVFIIEAGLLVAMSRALDSPKMFLILWSILLVVDIIWSWIVRLIQTRVKSRWASNNLCWLIIAWIVWFSFLLGLSHINWLNESHISNLTVIAVMVIEILRSVWDYKINWDFYFPRISK